MYFTMLPSILMCFKLFLPVLTCNRFQTSWGGCTAGWCRCQREQNLQPRKVSNELRCYSLHSNYWNTPYTLNSIWLMKLKGGVFYIIPSPFIAKTNIKVPAGLREISRQFLLATMWKEFRKWPVPEIFLQSQSRHRAGSQPGGLIRWWGSVFGWGRPGTPGSSTPTPENRRRNIQILISL